MDGDMRASDVYFVFNVNSVGTGDLVNLTGAMRHLCMQSVCQVASCTACYRIIQYLIDVLPLSFSTRSRPAAVKIRLAGPGIMDSVFPELPPV